MKELSDTYDIYEIAAAALYATYGERKEPSAAEEEEVAGNSRLFLTVGRKDNITASDIVRSLKSEAQIPFHEIGKINVFDKFTFVEVSQEYSDRVIRSLNDIMMKGRRIKVRKATAKTA